MSTRKDLVEARLRRGWSQGDLAAKLEVRRETVSEWERGVKAPYPAHVQRLCEVFNMTSEELGLYTNNITNDIVLSGKCIEDIISQCAAGIEICRKLSYEQISSENIRLAHTILATYVPMLHAVSCVERTAPLLTQIYQLQHNSAFHIESTLHALHYGEEAVRYARIVDDAAILTTTLHELASVYEWPLPGWQPRQRHRKTLELAEEMIHIQEERERAVPYHVQAWNYIRHAKFQALNGLKQDAYTSIGKANDVMGNIIPSPTDLINLSRQTAIAYSYLGEQTKAVSAFTEVIAIDGNEVKPALPLVQNTLLSISNYVHISLFSETLYSTLRLPTPKKDRDLSILLWKTVLSKALELRSATYFSEAQRNLDTMECVWPGDPEVNDLRDLLVPWE